MPYYPFPTWFPGYIRQDDIVFPYIGERDPVMAVLSQRSLFRRFLDVFLPHANLAALLKALAGIPPLSAPKGPTLGSEIVAALTAADLQKTIAVLLTKQHERSRKEGRYFERVAGAEPAVFETRFQDLQDRLTTIQGHLIHREALAQYNALAAVPVLKSRSKWLLADTPPHLQIPGRNGVTGQYVLLAEEDGFTGVFRDYLPFCPDIGWYPNVRITGFFEQPTPPNSTLPTLRIGLVEYRAPFALAAKVADLVDLAKAALTDRGKLGDREDTILFAYLAPILFRGSATSPKLAPPDLAITLKQYPSIWAKDLPIALSDFYSAL